LWIRKLKIVVSGSKIRQPKFMLKVRRVKRWISLITS
jgi:hypothetical protein